MQNKTLLITIACGLMTAFLLLAPVRLGGMGAGLSLFALSPLFVAALGFGTIAGGISGLVAAAVVAFMTGLKPAIATFCFTLLPAVWVGHMAGLVNRDDGDETWFPLPIILLRMALLSAALVVALGIINGFDIDGATESLAKLYAEFYAGMAREGAAVPVPSEAALQATARQMIQLLPLAMPASLLIMYVINLALGARIARSQNWMLRPKDDVPATASLPTLAVAIFALAIATSVLGGTIGLAAKVVAGAIGAAFMLVGLAVMHFVTRGVAARGMILGIAYAATVISLFPAFLFVVIGLAETLVGIRARRTGST